TEVRWAAASPERARALAAELVALTPNVLFADNTFVLRALQQSTRTLPVVFARISDPVENGFVSSLARPRTNMTGFANGETSALTKLVEFTRELAPDVRRLGIIISSNQWQSVSGKNTLDAIAAAAASAGLNSTLIEAGSARGFEDAIAEFGNQ